MRPLSIVLTLLASSVSAAEVPLVGVDEYDVAARLRRIESFPERAQEMPPVKATIAVDSQRAMGDLSPLFFGYNLEDLSHEIFPGLYAADVVRLAYDDATAGQTPTVLGRLELPQIGAVHDLRVSGFLSGGRGRACDQPG